MNIVLLYRIWLRYTLAICSGLCLLKTSVGGQTWNPLTSGTGRRLDAVAFLSLNQMVAVGQKDGGNFVLVYSNDGGANWADATIAAPPATADLKAVAFNGANGLTVGRNGTILRSTDSGVNWTDESGVTNADFDALAVNGATAVAVGKKDGGSFNIARSTDSGDNWTVPALPAGSQDLNAVAFISPTALVAVGKNGTILRSADGGANWTDETGVTGVELNTLTFSGSTVLAVGTDDGGNFTIARSIDSGDNWGLATVAAGTATQLDAIAFATNGALAIGQKDGVNWTVLRSTDGGANWAAPTTLPAGAEDLSALATSGNGFAIAVGTNGAILVSNDSGDTWEDQSIPGNDLLDVAIINPVITVGQSGTIFLSPDQATGAAAATSSPVLVAASPNVIVPLEETKDVPFGGIWLLPLLVLGCGLYRWR